MKYKVTVTIPGDGCREVFMQCVDDVDFLALAELLNKKKRGPRGKKANQADLAKLRRDIAPDETRGLIHR